MPNFDVGSFVWLDGENGYQIPAVVVGVSGSSLKIQNEQTGKTSSVPAKLAIQRIDHGKHGAEDMIKMDDLNEGSILHNLARRYEANLIYTYIGKILVAVNPYQLYSIYSDENVDKYTTSTIGSLPPHIFAIGSAAYSEVQRNDMNQVIVISGESGAGKTESTKQLVQYLATANKTKGSLITEQIVEATPLLESFGNAKTVKNDNSSRFGKYLEIYFSNAGLICGGRVSEYLLERSRIVSQSVDERNYHIFYEMLAGLPQETKSKLQLKNASDFAYLNQGGTSYVLNRDDKAVFNNVTSAMDILRINSSERDGIFTTLAAILHLGNAQFYKGLASSHDVAVLKDEAEAKIAANLLGLNSDDLIQALTHKNTETRGEYISSPRNTDQAVDARDAIAKELYSRVFTWLVNRINGIVFYGKKGPSIAILDIFGFEDFQTNSFEQLCINYANESLQFFFNQFVFKLEQDEYGLEGIQFREISFTDNQACLDLLARPPHGILHLLTDESNFPKATDSSFLEKCHQYHKSNKSYVKPKMQLPEFGINHFAGPVTYQVRGFLDKNRDSLKQDLTDLLCKCKSPFIRDLISDLMGDPTIQIGGLKGIRNSKVNSLKAPSNSAPKNTVCAKFNDSLIRLVVAMKRCNPFFIRCIKPNANKAPDSFVNNLVMQQLRYSGVLETVKIRKSGFPVRIGYQEFVIRYKCLSNRMVLNGMTSQQNCVIIMDFMGISNEDYQLGRSKLFLREKVEFQLEESRRAKQVRMAVLIQSKVRGYLINKQYLQMKKATIILQSNTRRVIARRNYEKTRGGFLMLQAIYRMRRHRRMLKSNLQSQTQPQDDSKRSAETAVYAVPQKANMESKEVEKQAMVDVTHLEIPADLAMVYARLDDWKVPYEKTVSQVNEVVKIPNTKLELPSDIDEHWFSKYAQKHFQQEIKLRFARAPIPTSALKLKYSDSIEAVSVFKLIMRFMEDETLSGVRELVLGNYIVQKGIFNPELQDEILAQLCNQTWGNQVNSYLEKAWLLIAMCLACFKPSDTLYKPLLKYSSDHAYNGFKAYCQQKLLRWNARKRPIPRSLPPTYLEWQAAKRKCSVALKCECVDGDKKMVEVDSSTTGEELAETILKDRGVPNPHGWSIDVYDPDCHYSLSGHDYVMDVMSEQEYPPYFPPGAAPALATLRPGNKLDETRKRALSNLHRPGHKKAKVSEIAHKFSFKEGARTPSSPSGPREDGLTAATSARISSTTLSQHEDRLVAQTSMRTTKTETDGPTVPIPPPPPPPGDGPIPPPPPPPPPIAPPTDNKILRRLTNKEANKKKKKPEPAGPQLSMAEVMAKAKKMSEARKSRALSSSDKEEVDSVEFKMGNLKKVQRNSTPKKEEPENELKRAMQAKANRASRLWQENENLESILYRKNSVDSHHSTDTKRQSENNNDSPNASSVNEDDLVTTIAVNNNSLSSSSSSNSLANKQDVCAFVDSLFDPVLSSNFNDLADEESVSNAIRGGGGMNQPGGAQTSTTLAGVSPPTVSMSSPMFVPVVQTPVAGMYNGYHGSSYVGMNGFAGGTPNMGSPGMIGMTSYPTPPQDYASMAAQQQMLLEHLMTQQKLIEDQQRQLSQKSTDHLALLQQQHEQQMKTLQEQLEAARAGLPNGTPHGIPNGTPVKTAIDTPQKLIGNGGLPNGTPQGLKNNEESPTPNGLVHNGSLVNGHETEPLVTGSSIVLDRVKSLEPPPPPPEFSDQESTEVMIIPPPPFTEPPSPPPPVEEPSVPYPPPPLTPPPSVPHNESKSSGVASAVAALEGKSPVTKNTMFELSPATPTRNNDEPRPGLKSRLSSNLTVFVQEDKKTQKLDIKSNVFLSSGVTPWKMSLRKEVFSPREKLDNRTEQRLVYLQVVRDSYSGACCRMRNTDCAKMKALLQRYGITPEHPNSSTPVEEIILQTARDLPLYFSRFYAVLGQNELPGVQYMAIGEKGVFLVKREKLEDELSIANEILYEDLQNVRVIKNKVVFSFKDTKITVPTNRAEEAKLMIDPYLIQIEKEAKYVRAMFDHVSQESSMLNFKKGDVIQIIDKPSTEEGWLFGVFAGRSGVFPSEFVTHIKEDPDSTPKSNLMKTASVGSLYSSESSPDLSRRRPGSVRSTKSDKSEYHQETKSMMEFAMHNFRHGQEVVHRQPDGTVRGTLRLKGKQSQRSQKNLEWTWKGLAELVKYSKSSIQASLLRLEPQHNKLAIECFHAIMKFMGDMQMGRGQKNTDLVYFLIKTCRETPVLCDEVYCQLIKQVTSNKSTQADSCSRGWRLMIIITSYIMCDKTLKPYLVKFLQSTACDPKREFHGAASICEQNLMKTFKYGGRRTHPSPIELKQLVQGRQTKRQIFLLPGNLNKMIKIQTCSTGYDVVKEMCNEMDLSTEGDYMEYGLFRSDRKQKTMVPIQVTDYVMDVIGLMEKDNLDYNLYFQRVLWNQTSRFDNELYVSVIYHQVLPDYLAGHLTGVLRDRSLTDALLHNQVAELGALQLLTNEKDQRSPIQSDVEKVIPKCIRDQLRAQQWLILVQDHFRSSSPTPAQARKRFLEIVSQWQFFGCTFFSVKYCSHPNVGGECIAAINRNGINFIDVNTKHLLQCEAFVRIISTRILVSDKKRFFLDLKIGDSMVQKVTRMETQEAKEIAGLIYNYVNAASTAINRPHEGLAGVIRQQDLKL